MPALNGSQPHPDRPHHRSSREAALAWVARDKHTDGKRWTLPVNRPAQRVCVIITVIF